MKGVCAHVVLKREGGWSSGSFLALLPLPGRLRSYLLTAWMALTVDSWDHMTPQSSLRTTIGVLEVRLPELRYSYTVRHILSPMF